ncbi:MAG: MFS transporter [Myxococcota bacterium]
MSLERNLRWYPWLQAGRAALFWLPVHVLWFSQHLDPAHVLRLEALYYLGVVVLEVPSGVMSDRLGRRPTLAIGALCWVAGSAVIAAGGSFATFALGQLLLAAGMAFHSGSDSSLLYDTLVALGRPHEIGHREAAAQSVALRVQAGAALIGGLSAGIDLRLGHALSAVAGLVAVAAALAMVEPPATEAPPSLADQARAVRRALDDRIVRWTTGFVVLFTVSVHVPYELVQPWLELVAGALDQPHYRAAPAVSGAVTALVTAVAALASPHGPALAERYGVRTVLLGAAAGLIAVTGAMAWLHPVVLVVLLLRAVPNALSGPVVAATFHPRLTARVRATYLSVVSLAGRLAFAAALAAGAASVGVDGGWTPAALHTLVALAVAFGAVGFGALALAGRR